ncbi:MAG TPA: hypothetical protein VGM17_02625 [Rhizomicrobium sp.]|jgi:hypothetical protein
MHYAIEFAPHIAPTLLWVLIALVVALVVFSFALRAPGAWARGVALAIVLLALADPLIVNETRQALPDIVALVVDHSASMDVRGRRAQADAAAEQIRNKLAADKSLEIRRAEVTTRPGEDTGTQLFGAIQSALASAPRDRIAGAIAITDGEVHDAPPNGKPALNAPLQALIAGQHDERDRKLTIVSASRFAIVGQDAEITLRVDDFGAPATEAIVDTTVDGVRHASRPVPTNRQVTIKIPVTHAGENVIELDAKPGPSELTLENNHAVVPVTGVRDRLRVLLVSGEPNAGERVWRSLLKADPSVDLIHFTILRSLSKQDNTPVSELSLIAFPTEELFVEKLSQFDLVIFDRCSTGGGMALVPLAYFDNIARYVENGGALLIASGPEFAGDLSIYKTPLASVLPAQPTGDVVAQPFKPVVTPAGLAHPVTRDLTGANTPAGEAPSWGRWFRLIGTSKVGGETLMSGPDNRPLLVLDRVGKGRVAEFLSDQEWLWARGFEGGGPDAELLRRLAHWLMKEPELEEERLSASILNGSVVIERHTMADQPKPVRLTYPSGKQTTITLGKVEPGLWRATAKAEELGLYRLTDGTLNAVTAAGPLNPTEVADMRATNAILTGPAEATGGSVHWLADSGVPDIRRVQPGNTASGDHWIGLRRNGAYRVTSVEQTALLPPWLALLLVIGTLLLAWRLEGR